MYLNKKRPGGLSYNSKLILHRKLISQVCSSAYENNSIVSSVDLELKFKIMMVMSSGSYWPEPENDSIYQNTLFTNWRDEFWKKWPLRRIWWNIPLSCILGILRSCLFLGSNNVTTAASVSISIYKQSVSCDSTNSVSAILNHCSSLLPKIG